MKGLSFSELMAKAWMEGRKTVTRQLMNPQPVMENNGIAEWPNPWPIKPPYAPGETVYIKETWGYKMMAGKFFLADQPTDSPYRRGGIVWKNASRMPEREARSHALIVSVRPERVQEITARECIKEGWLAGSVIDDNDEEVFRAIRESPMPCLTAAKLLKVVGIPPRKWFQELWKSLYPGSWERNDWVWRIELEKK